MSIFLKSFFGKLFATLFTAICVILGFGPEEWAKFIINDASKWITPQVAQYGFMLLGFLTLITLVWNSIFAFKDKILFFIKKIIDEIEWIDGPHSIHTFKYVISRPHNLALVEGINLQGRNTKKKSINVKKAYLRSLVTGECINANIEGLEAIDIEIFPNVNFSLFIKFPNEDDIISHNSISGISLESFLRRFSNFEIIVETNKKDYRIEFNSNETKEWVSLLQLGLMMPQPNDKAKVLKKVSL